MTRLVNNPINAMVQVLDANGDKVTSATVNYIVYNYNSEGEVWEEYTSGTMEHIGNGIYVGDFTPSDPGEFTFYAYSENPKFHETYTYYVEALPVATKFAWKKQAETIIYTESITQNDWIEVFNQSGGIRGEYMRLWHDNSDGHADKNVEIELTIDGHVKTAYISPMTGATNYTIADYPASGGNASAIPDGTFPGVVFMGETIWSGSDPKTWATKFLDCHSLRVRIRMTSAPGTGEAFAGSIEWSKLEVVEETP